jgi:mitochondrial import inner membrane translocase subunit TIM23
MNLTMSIICSSVSFATGAYVIAGNDLENKIAQSIGLDPIITMGLVLIGCGGVGWLIGPFFGTALFQGRFRGLQKMIEAVCTIINTLVGMNAKFR